jgi:hypothetical protein
MQTRERECIMTIRTAREYEKTSPEDQREFNRWLGSNAILSSIFAIGVLVMALAAIVVPYQTNKDMAAVVSTSVSGK